MGILVSSCLLYCNAMNAVWCVCECVVSFFIILGLEWAERRYILIHDGGRTILLFIIFFNTYIIFIIRRRRINNEKVKWHCWWMNKNREGSNGQLFCILFYGNEFWEQVKRILRRIFLMQLRTTVRYIRQRQQGRECQALQLLPLWALHVGSKTCAFETI